MTNAIQDLIDRDAYDTACCWLRQLIEAALPDQVNDPDDLRIGDSVTIAVEDAEDGDCMPFGMVAAAGHRWKFDFYKTREQRHNAGYVFRLAMKGEQ